MSRGAAALFTKNRQVILYCRLRANDLLSTVAAPIVLIMRLVLITQCIMISLFILAANQEPCVAVYL